MRARRLAYAAEALADLTAIRAYFRGNVSPTASARMIARIRKVIASARELPSAGSPRPEYRPTCRFVVEHPYIVYYDFDGSTMTVLRILHWARDRVRLMGGE